MTKPREFPMPWRVRHSEIEPGWCYIVDATHKMVPAIAPAYVGDSRISVLGRIVAAVNAAEGKDE